MAGQALGGIFPALVNILVISLQVRICWASVADPDPSDPYVFGPPGSGSESISQRYRYGSGSFYHQAKIVRKIEIPTVLWLLFDFSSLKNDINVPSKRSKLKSKKLFFCWHFEGQWRKQQDPDLHPDSLVRGMAPRIQILIRIHTKMSWIRNTVLSMSTYCNMVWLSEWLFFAFRIHIL